MSGILSNLSAPSNYISLYVQNVRATQLEYTDKIRITWDIHPDAIINFRVYRDTDKANPSVLPIASNVSTNSYEDADVVAGTAYFYRVSWVDADGEHGEDGFYAL